MRKLTWSIYPRDLGILLVSLMTTVSAVSANDSVDIFQRDLERIKVQLKNKKLTVNQAPVLLLALQARQNNYPKRRNYFEVKT